MEEGKMYRMDWNGTRGFVEIKNKVLEIGQRVYGFLGYAGSESGTFIVAEEPDERGNQLMVEIGGQHRFAYWTVGQNDRPLSKKFGIGYYWDDREPDYRMPADEINELHYQCEIQQAWNERLKRNKQIASQKRTESLRAEYGGILTECDEQNRFCTKFAKQNMMLLLKHTFPGVRFKCRKTCGSYEVEWEDGPTEQQVCQVTRLFTDTTFNGYTDMEETCSTEFNLLYGGIGYGPYTKRTYSEKVWNEAKDKFFDLHSEAIGLTDDEFFVPQTYSKFANTTDRRIAVSECLSRYLKDKDLYVKPETKTRKAVSKSEGKATGIQLIDYSEKAVAVIGETRDYAEKLKALGGRFNGKLKCGAGWIFSKKREAELHSVLGI